MEKRIVEIGLMGSEQTSPVCVNWKQGKETRAQDYDSQAEYADDELISVVDYATEMIDITKEALDLFDEQTLIHGENLRVRTLVELVSLGFDEQ